MTHFDTEAWPVVPARWFIPVKGKKRTVRVVVIHDMEADESKKTAENVAHYFATTDTKASAHICVDNDSTIQCVMDNNVAWAAPGANNDGIQIELAGYGKQTKDEWMDDYSKALLERAADATAQYCLKYGIPVVHLTNEELEAGKKGIVGHVQVSQVYKKSNHTDPGPNFPWLYFISQVEGAYQRYRRKNMSGT